MKPSPKNRNHVYLYSYPRSGKRWFLFMLIDYIDNVYRLSMNWDEIYNPKVRTTTHFEDDENSPIIIHKKHDVPEIDKIGNKSIILLRNPVDILASFYYYSKYRVQKFDGSKSEFIQSESRGLPKIIRFYNEYSKYIDKSNFIFITYESLISSTPDELKKCITSLNLQLHEEMMHHSIDKFRFDKMKKEEIENSTQSKTTLKLHGNKGIHARKGKIGLGKNEFDQADNDAIQLILNEKLHPKMKQLLLI